MALFGGIENTLGTHGSLSQIVFKYPEGTAWFFESDFFKHPPGTTQFFESGFFKYPESINFFQF
jgi:hypothetical protein